MSKIWQPELDYLPLNFFNFPHFRGLATITRTNIIWSVSNFGNRKVPKKYRSSSNMIYVYCSCFMLLLFVCFIYHLVLVGLSTGGASVANVFKELWSHSLQSLIIYIKMSRHLLTKGLQFTPGTLISPASKTDRHNMTIVVKSGV